MGRPGDNNVSTSVDESETRSLSLNLGRISLTHFSFDACFVNNVINVVSCYAGLDGSSCNVEYLSGQSTHFPHCLNAFLVENLNIVPLDIRVVGDARD